MFDIGFWELVLLFVIGLLVLGPQRLPKVAADLGKWVGRARRTANELRRQLEREIELSEITRPPPPPPRPTEEQPPATEPQAPDPYTPEMQHGHESPAATPLEQNPAAPPYVDDAAPPAEPSPVESSPSQDTTQSPTHH
jgi:sec-independent protein translocase protein TatB